MTESKYFCTFIQYKQKEGVPSYIAEVSRTRVGATLQIDKLEEDKMSKSQLVVRVAITCA